MSNHRISKKTGTDPRISGLKHLSCYTGNPSQPTCLRLPVLPAFWTESFHIGLFALNSRVCGSEMGCAVIGIAVAAWLLMVDPSGPFAASRQPIGQ